MDEPSRPSSVSRRQFLKTGVASASVASFGAINFFPRRVFGANDRVRVAICGLHGRGMDHIRSYAKVPQAEIAALCDIDENVLRERLADVEKMGIPKPVTYVDVRKLLDDKSIDAVSIATPDSWHTLIAIWACQAGKDVYVEKPCSHNIWETKQLVRAAQRYNRIVQHGTQSRSSPAVRDAINRVQEGVVGDLYLSRGLCYKWRNTIGYAPVAQVPTGVHYDLWQGPAPKHAFTHNRFHYNWHWFWWYGSGDLGNQGIHQLDIARWGLGVGYPNRATATGGHFMFKDDQETPNTLNCAFEFDLPDGSRKMLEFEVRHWITNHEAEIGAGNLPRHVVARPKTGANAGYNNTVGNIFYGSKGYLAYPVGKPAGYKTWIGESQEPGPEGHEAGTEVLHFANFIDCVISRKKEDLHAPPEVAAASVTLIYLANASYRLGRTINFNPETQEVVDDQDADMLVQDADRGYRSPFIVPRNV
ncbi:MAG: Gfo/Idh/MocA family protein [Terriglobia bacterium]